MSPVSVVDGVLYISYFYTPSFVWFTWLFGLWSFMAFMSFVSFIWRSLPFV